MSPLHGRGARAWILVIAAAAACSKTPASPSNVDRSAPAVSVSGIVFDSTYPVFGGALPPVSGAQVELIYTAQPRGAWPDSDRPAASVSSGPDGNFRIDGVASGQSILLRAHKDGYSVFEQTFSSLTSDKSVNLPLRKIRLTLTGVITETPLTGSLPVAGAIVEILTGANQGMRAIADSQGVYALASVWGEFDISVSSPNHETRIAHAAVEVNPRLDVHLVPRNARTRTTFTGELCTVVRLPAWLKCTAPFDRSHIFTLDRPGPTTITVDYEYVGDYYGNSLTVEMRCGSAVTFEKRFAKGGPYPPVIVPDNVRGPLQLSLQQPCTYEFRLFNFIADTKGGSQTKYRIDVDYP